jgi:hypothetical protein
MISLLKTNAPYVVAAATGAAGLVVSQTKYASIIPIPHLRIVSIALVALAILAKIVASAYNYFFANRAVTSTPAIETPAVPAQPAPAKLDVPPTTEAEISKPPAAAPATTESQPPAGAPKTVAIELPPIAPAHTSGSGGGGGSGRKPVSGEINKTTEDPALAGWLTKQKDKADATAAAAAKTNSKKTETVVQLTPDTLAAAEAEINIKIPNAAKQSGLIALVQPNNTGNIGALVAFDMTAVNAGAFKHLESENSNFTVLNKDQRGLVLYTDFPLRNEMESPQRTTTIAIKREKSLVKTILVRSSISSTETETLNFFLSIEKDGKLKALINNKPAHFVFGSEGKAEELARVFNNPTPAHKLAAAAKK